MLTSKQRAKLRGISSKEDTILQVGKNGIGDTLIKQVADALQAREIIKMRVLENALMDPHQAAEELASATESEVVQVIGTKFVLYKRNSKNPIIEL